MRRENKVEKENVRKEKGTGERRERPKYGKGETRAPGEKQTRASDPVSLFTKRRK